MQKNEFMKEKRPVILLSNDDGYMAKGIGCLIDMVKDLADLVVCAPDAGRSGYSCAFSATAPLWLKLRHDEPGLKVWSCNGTPVDCVKLALDQFFTDRRPDMVIGGINHGDNASVNAHYSGTMGVTLEGCMKYIPSVAFSLCDPSPDADFEPLRRIVREITALVLKEGLPKGSCLNVNFPKQKTFSGVRVCRMAKGTWDNECVEMPHPHGGSCFWMTGSYTNDEPEAEDTDNWALSHGYVAITPTTIDMTSYELKEKLERDCNIR